MLAGDCQSFHTEKGKVANFFMLTFSSDTQLFILYCQHLLTDLLVIYFILPAFANRPAGYLFYTANIFQPICWLFILYCQHLPTDLLVIYFILPTFTNRSASYLFYTANIYQPICWLFILYCQHLPTDLLVIYIILPTFANRSAGYLFYTVNRSAGYLFHGLYMQDACEESFSPALVESFCNRYDTLSPYIYRK